MSGVLGAAILLAAGVGATILAFPPFGLWPLAFVMYAPLFAVADRGRPARAFAVGWLFFVALGLVIGRWLLHALVVEYGVAPAAAGTFSVLLVGAYATLPSAAVALHAAAARSLPAALAPLSLAGLFVLAEWLRAEPLGLPWVLAGQPLASAPALIQSAAWGGVYAPGLLVAGVAAGLGLAAARRSLAPLAAPALLVVVAAGVGVRGVARQVDRGAPLRVGVVQASVPQAERFREGSARRNTARHVALTRALAAREPLDLVVWSETAVDTDLDAAPGLAAALRRAAAEADVPILTGAPRSLGGRLTNAVVLFDARGLVASYDKQRLVPFSERDPAWVGFVAPLLGPVTEGPGYEPGPGPSVLRAADVALGTPICFEVTYPELVRGFRSAGATLLVNLSNDAWFGRSGYLEMHFLHAIFRAVELGSWVVRGANTGISGVVDPVGRVVARLPVFEEGTLVATVHEAGPPTFYARHGAAPFLVALAAGVALSIGYGRATGRRPRS